MGAGNELQTARNLNITSSALDISTNTNTLTTAGVLTVDGGTLTATSGTIDANGSVDVSSGVLTAPSGTMTVSGAFSHSGGTFTHSSGTVDFDGTNQAINGSTTFNNFKKTESTNDATDVTLTFDNLATQTISGLLTLDGLDADDRINLVSNTPGTQWSLTANGTFAIDYVDVQDSDASAGTTISHTFSVSSGNNLNWGFTSGTITVSGIAYATDESTALITTSRTVNLRVNGTLAGTGDGGTGIDETDTGTGAFSFTSVSVAAGDTITLYLNAETEKANTITITDGVTNITGIPLYDDHVVIRSDRGTTAITIPDLWDYDNSSAGASTDMLFDAVDATPATQPSTPAALI